MDSVNKVPQVSLLETLRVNEVHEPNIPFVVNPSVYTRAEGVYLRSNLAMPVVSKKILGLSLSLGSA